MLNINLYLFINQDFSFYYKYKFITVKLFKPGYLLLSNYFICKNRRSVLESSFSGNIFMWKGTRPKHQFHLKKWYTLIACLHTLNIYICIYLILKWIHNFTCNLMNRAAVVKQDSSESEPSSPISLESESSSVKSSPRKKATSSTAASR